ncbi:MAG: ferric reductase-like transmembrane domain-containing protein [Tannerella sp.]|jgi:DMSO/TMAO reductase YedYZ heme-binding membrane subunit|nr:ferric reductase-like transmembrane domain-containing protein [Tannerella sp.]
MVKLFIDFIQFLNTLAPLLTALGVLTLLAVLLSKSIKRHATVYYLVFAVPFALVAIPFIGRLLGMEGLSFRIPFMSGLTRDYIHAGTLGFPLLVIIMYTGALNPKNPYVKKLLAIRKELSILSGFPILTHSLIRFTSGLNALQFFTHQEEYLASGRVTNVLGAGISNFSFVLGLLLLALFLPLWITSFDSVRKRMGSAGWKKLQRWSYVLYALLFIHAIGIQTGSMLNPRGGRGAHPAATEVSATESGVASEVRSAENQGVQQRTGDRERGGNGDATPSTGRRGGNRPETASPGGSGSPTGTVAPSGGGRPPTWSFTDIKVGSQTRQYIHIASLLLIFGSYLYLRLRKAKQDAAKRRNIH